MTRVRLIVPQEKQLVPDEDGRTYPDIQGMHLAYHGQRGEVVCGAANGGAFVHFDGMAPRQYVGCPATWLEEA